MKPELDARSAAVADASITGPTSLTAVAESLADVGGMPLVPIAAPMPLAGEGGRLPVTRRLPRLSDRSAEVLAVSLAISGGSFLAVVTVMAFSGSLGWGYDFEAYYLAAARLARGDTIYQTWTLTDAFRPGPFGLYLYAPPLAVAFLPLTMLSLQLTTALWLVARLAMLVGACALMPVSRRVRLLTFAVAAISEPVLIDLNLGNVSIVVMFLTVVLWRWLDRPPGSIALAATISVRPSLGLFLAWWVARRAWRPVVWTVGAGIAMIALTLPFAGVSGYADYLRVLTNLSEVTGVFNNLDLGSTVLRLGVAPEIAGVVLFGGYVLALVASLVSLRRDRETSFMVTLGATLLLSPLLWDHYLVSLLLPAAFLANRGRTWGLVLPLLAWLPQPLVPLLAVAATLLPFIASRPRDGYVTGRASDEASLPAVSKRTVAPA